MAERTDPTRLPDLWSLLIRDFGPPGDPGARARLIGMSENTPAAGHNLRVMLVDDHEVVRDGVKALLQAAEDLTVISEASSVAEAVRYAAAMKPDVVVMDVRLADGSGIEATREIRAQRPETQVLMLTSFADDEALFASIMAGAAGYVLKQIRGGELVNAIRMVGRGQSLLDPAVTATVLDRLRKGKHLHPGRRGLDQPADRRRAPPRRKDGQELRVEHPLQARGGQARRGSRLPGPSLQARRLKSLRQRAGRPLASIPPPGDATSTKQEVVKCAVGHRHWESWGAV